MELIAASRILRAQQRVAAARPYAELLTEAIRNISSAGGGGAGHPLLEQRESVQTVAFVVIAADRGLAGGYNSGVIRAAAMFTRSASSQSSAASRSPSCSSPSQSTSRAKP